MPLSARLASLLFLCSVLISSTLRAQRRVIKTSRDGKTMPLRQCVSSSTWSRVSLDSQRKASTRSSHLSETNRNAAIVASIKGRARLGLLDRIFLRDLNLRVVDLGLEAVVRSGVVARCHNVGGDVACLVVEEVVDVEEVEVGLTDEAGGRVTSQIIVVKS